MLSQFDTFLRFGLQVYEIGGYDEHYDYLNSTYMYDTLTITWSRVADMPTPRGDHMCVDFMNEIYVLGGYYVSAPTRLVFPSFN